MEEVSSPRRGLTDRWEGPVFNLVCAVYFFTVAPVVVRAGDRAMRYPEATVIWFGVAILVISLLEVYAFPRKMRFVARAAHDRGDTMEAGFWLWMFHTVISVILVFQVAGAFGVKVGEGEDDSMPWWLGLLIFVVVIKELVFLGFILVGDDKPPPERYARPNRKEWPLDLILIAYACLAYSATWGAITTNLSMERENPPMYALNLFVSSLLFLIFYLPLRIPYWLEELSRVKTKKDVAWLVASVLIVLVPVILRLP